MVQGIKCPFCGRVFKAQESVNFDELNWRCPRSTCEGLIPKRISDLTAKTLIELIASRVAALQREAK